MRRIFFSYKILAVQKLAVLHRLIMPEQMLFGLPWAFIGALFPFISSRPSFVFTEWIWILLAFSGARTAGMSLNRLIDYEIDLANPRTRQRPLQRGEISQRQVGIVALISLILFFVATFKIGPTVFLLSIPVALLILGYSYMKRYTALCHFVLGLIESFIPILGWLSFSPHFSMIPLFLGFAVFCWISGMDVIYALQDFEFDKSASLHSLPVALGVKRSFFVAKMLHGLSFGSLLVAGVLAEVGLIYYAGLMIIAFLFAYQHRFPHRSFLLNNALISLTQLFFTLCSVW